MSRGRILVVDDEIYIVHILDFSLGMEGYEVLTALDGEEALAKARESKPLKVAPTEAGPIPDT